MQKQIAELRLVIRTESAPSRVAILVRQELRFHLRRPLFWMLVLLAGLVALALANGLLHIHSGSDSQSATLTSEFAQVQQLSLVVFCLFTLFVAVGSGLCVLQDDELRVSDLLHTTGLRHGEYVWGKFLASWVSLLVALAAQIVFTVVCNHVFAHSDRVGPLLARNYVRPAVVVAIPQITFFAGVSFWVGARTRSALLVVLVPLVIAIATFALWQWAPTWLDPRLALYLSLLDPSGFRWVTQEWLCVDRGVEFYNQSAVPYGGAFLLSRLVFATVGLAAVHRVARRRDRNRATAMGHGARDRITGVVVPLAHLGLMARPAAWRSVVTIARAELTELRSQPGVPMFLVVILLCALPSALLQTGMLEAPLLLTPGLFAISTMSALTMLFLPFVMFYVIESLRRERTLGLEPIVSCTPVPTWALVIGKLLANFAVLAATLFVALIIAVGVMLAQGKVPIDLVPFLQVWGGLLAPTLILWSTFVASTHALTRSRYGAYAICLAVLALTVYFAIKGELGWVTNWPLIGALRWTDFGTFDVGTTALFWNRVTALCFAVWFGFAAVRWFPRVVGDPSSSLDRLLGALAGWAVCTAIALLSLLQLASVAPGEQHRFWYFHTNPEHKPTMVSVQLDVDLKPSERWFDVAGTYVFRNDLAHALDKFELTIGKHFQDVVWRIDWQNVTPELHDQGNESLRVEFPLAPPVPPAQTWRVDFRYHAVMPPSTRTEQSHEFLLPAGVVLTNSGPTFVPVCSWEGYQVPPENQDKGGLKERPTPPAFGSSHPFDVTIAIHGPPEYTYCSVGSLASDTVENGERTMVWRTDHPVVSFNLVAGKWAARRGNGFTIFHHPAHTYNLDEMASALERGRRCFSEWFAPYPWRELKLCEFPGLVDYAQGFPTNIPFAESMGFLTHSTPRTRTAFVVTAHEVAHQWWGNLVVPGSGAGGQVLSEGLAHFATILLMEECFGARERIEICKRFEESYFDNRWVDHEKPLIEFEHFFPGYNALIYDKGGWAFWMLAQAMGKDACLRGLREYVARYRNSVSHPLLADCLATLRPFAADAEAFDDVVQQWFKDMVMPQFEVRDAHRSRSGSAWLAQATIENLGTSNMPVAIAATRGERFVDVDYREMRSSVRLGPGERVAVELRCAFPPDAVIVDADALVMQRARASARAALE